MCIIIVRMNLVVRHCLLFPSSKCHHNTVVSCLNYIWSEKDEHAGTYISLRCTVRGTRHNTQHSRTANYSGSLQGRRAGRAGKVERWKVLQEKSRHLRVEGPWCPSAVDVKLRVWSLPLCGPWALPSRTPPPSPIFNRQPCSGPSLASSLAERESTLMDIILPLFSPLFSLPLVSYHFHCMLYTLTNSHNALPCHLKAFFPYFPPLKLTLFNICLYASSIFFHCLISELRRIPQQDWPVTYKMLSLLSTDMCALWLSCNTLQSLLFVWYKPSVQMSSFF